LLSEESQISARNPGLAATSSRGYEDYRAADCEGPPVRFRRLAPAAAPLAVRDLWSGFRGLLSSQGAEARLTRELSKALAVEHIFFVSSGRAALSLILTALHRLSGRRR